MTVEPTKPIESKLAAEAAEELAALASANREYAARYPGEPPSRQPVHTVYGGAHLFRADISARLGKLARASMETYAPDPFAFARALGLPGHAELPDREADLGRLAARFEEDPEAVRAESAAAWLALAVYRRVHDKLRREAVEDFRIDFEDGFGNRPDAEEDRTAQTAAREVARGMRDGLLPPFVGIRIKPLNEELKARSVRTLDIFVTTLVEEAGRLPDGFVVTLPKIPVAAHVATLASLLGRLERRLGLRDGALRLELMIELTQSLLGPDGRSNLPPLLDAAAGRCVAAHFGTYDYTASCNITAAWQKMDHRACDFALDLMKVAYAGTGIFLSDGATNVMPVGPHRAAAGEALTEAQEADNRRAVHGAWRVAYDHTRRSLQNGFYQGWDLHPGQLPVRYAACYAFFLEGFAAAAERLRNFIDKAAQATLVGNVFDDAATGQGLLNYFLRALNCGAVSLDEVASTGLTRDEIQTRSFVRILDERSRRAAAG